VNFFLLFTIDFCEVWSSLDGTISCIGKIIFGFKVGFGFVRFRQVMSSQDLIQIDFGTVEMSLTRGQSD